MKEKKQKNKAVKPDAAEAQHIDEASRGDAADSLSDKPETEVTADEQADCGDAQIKELTDRWKRTLAEFDNFRKRTIKEKASMYDDGVRDTIAKLLPIIDNFERALSSETDKKTGFYKGVDMIAKQIGEYLNELDVCEIPGVGESFDPNVHYAVSHAEDESFGENEVIEVLQKGYKYKDKVIRPSMVKVAN